MRDKFKKLSQEIYEILEPQMIVEDIAKIKSTNGNISDAPRACKARSSVYIHLSHTDDILYVGETGKSINSRCFGDGNCAHCRKSWFIDVAKVKHFTASGVAEFSEMERKMSEQALSIHMSPAHYG